MKREGKQAFIFLLPTAVIMLGLVFYPIIVTFNYSLREFKLTEPDSYGFVGLNNYCRILKSEEFYEVLVNALVVLGIVLLVGIFSSIVVALILNRKTRLCGLLTAVAIVPWALPPIVNGVVWKFVFYPGFGLMNNLLYRLGIIDSPIQWLNTRYGTLIIIGLVVAWRVIPFCAIVLLANMQAIPPQLYQAAEVDGAGDFQVFKHITIPLLMPSVAIVFTNLTMGAINVFDEIVALVGFRSMGQTLLIFNYTQTFSFLNFGLGSAISYTIMIGSGVIGYFYIRSLSGKGGAA